MCFFADRIIWVTGLIRQVYIIIRETIAEPFDAASNAGDSCFHCGQPVPDGADYQVHIEGRDRAMCCPGCAAVAETILAAGNGNFYRVRRRPAPGAGQPVTPSGAGATVFRRAEVERQYIHTPDSQVHEASLLLEGVTCAACSWLIERQLNALDGVIDARINYATRHALLRWNPTQVRLAGILEAIESIGFRAIPTSSERERQARVRDRRAQQRRLAVAGLFGMQVMMLSVGLYAGAWSGIEPEFEQFFRWLALLLTLPVIGYSAFPYFAAAWRDLARRTVTMDLPVALAIGIAFGASVLATLRGTGEIYFDSVVMFVFFLGGSRYFESMARQRCANTVERLLQSLPQLATRLEPDGLVGEQVAAIELEVGDRVQVAAGEAIAADGEVIAGASDVDESLLSGESMPVTKQTGDRVFGGSVNRTNPLQIRVTAVGADTTIAGIRRSMERALADRAPLSLLADRVAARFIVAILAVSAMAAIYWWLRQPEQWLETALAVLIVSCPCALSLAIPAAASALLGRLQAEGILVKRSAALESIPRLTHVVFDKTGTLTRGEPVLQQIETGPGIDRAGSLQLAAGLASQSRHPLAEALVRAARLENAVGSRATEVESVAGGGIRGSIGGRFYYLGSAEFVNAVKAPGWSREQPGMTESQVYLATSDAVIARFTFVDELRDDAPYAVAELRARGLGVVLMTGDREAAAMAAARALGIDQVHAGLSPEGKQQAVKTLQAGGGRVMMIGDGINDAPVLAAAEVSLAMGAATALARGSADILLLSNRLGDVPRLLDSALRGRRIVSQNLAWALIYNFGAIPAAAMGLVSPWLAALGMSLSSLAVVLNALRLTR